MADKADITTKILIDEKSLKWIFDKYFPTLSRYATEFLIDEEKAKDVATNVFVELWKQRARLKFNEEKPLRHYLYQMTRFQAMDQVEDKKKQQKLVKDLKYLGNFELQPDEMDNAKIMAEALRYMYEQIDELTPQYRTVIKMTLQQASNEEIAEAMGITASAVRSNKARAIETLQKKVQKKFKGHQLLPVILLLLEPTLQNACHGHLPLQ